ncbi:MAG: Yae1 family protein, partial [Chthoniobacterales bacterium]|nr:Yae1 family protein [Chthoniobacterales bacterium]
YDKSWDAVSSERTLLSGRYKEGLAEGKAEGIQEGEQKGLRSMLERQLRRRFPNNITNHHLNLINDADRDTLSIWGDNLIDAKRIEEVFKLEFEV